MAAHSKCKSWQTAVVEEPSFGRPVSDQHPSHGDNNTNGENSSVEHAVHKKLSDYRVPLIEHEVNFLKPVVCFNLCHNAQVS